MEKIKELTIKMLEEENKNKIDDPDEHTIDGMIKVLDKLLVEKESKKKKIVRFFAGIIIVVFLATIFTTVKVAFFDCKYGQCVVRECIEVDQKCEADNYDPKTGQELHNCCSNYETRVVPFKDHLIKMIAFYGLLGGSGLGIALGVFLASRSKKIYISTPNCSDHKQCNGCELPIPITFWERFRDKLKRYLP